MTKSGYTDHGLVGSVDDSFAFGPGTTESSRSDGPIIDIEVVRDEPDKVGTKTIEGMPAQRETPVTTIVAELMTPRAPLVDEFPQAQNGASKASMAKINAIATEAITAAKRQGRAKAEPGPKVLQSTVRKRLFSTAGSRTPWSAPPAEKAVQVPPSAAATSIQPHPPEEPPPIPLAAPVTSDAAPVAAAVPAQPMEVVPPRMLELTDDILPESPRPTESPRPRSHVRQWKKAAELAAIIEHDLAQHPDSPKQGLRITVYGGGADWRAMLTILPAAGGVRNAQQLRDLTDHLAEGLRQRYKMAWD